LFFPFFIIVILCLASVSIGHAQSAEPDPSSKARARFGPVFLNPTLALTNLGVDTNVFNEPDQAAPKQDFTMTVTPATDLWLRLGRTRLSGSIREDLVYYKTYSSERSANSSYRADWLVPLNRLTFHAGGDYRNARQRPGFEIDARSRLYEHGFSGSAEIRALSKTFFGLRGERRTYDFAVDAFFLGTSLRDTLNRTTTTGALTVRYRLTPLTTLTLDMSHAQDRFAFSSARDSDSTAIAAGVTLDPFALIKGSASFGYRSFQPLSAGVPEYQGSTAAFDLSYVPLGTTKLAVQGARDVQYSYDINRPYYVLTGATGSIGRHVFGPVDAVGRFGRQRLDYRDRASSIVPTTGRTDYVHTYGGGVGYRVGRDVRVGFNIDHNDRTSSASDVRGYSGLTFGTSVTYAF
jgi:hypothetical protein